MLIQQGLQVLSIGGQVLSRLQRQLRTAVRADIDPPQEDQGRDHHHRQQAVQKDQEAVVPVGHGAVRVKPSSRLTKSYKFPEILHAEPEDQPQKGCLRAKKRDPSHQLPPHELSEAHDDKGYSGFPIPLRERYADILQISAQDAQRIPASYLCPAILSHTVQTPSTFMIVSGSMIPVIPYNFFRNQTVPERCLKAPATGPGHLSFILLIRCSIDLLSDRSGVRPFLLSDVRLRHQAVPAACYPA